MKLLLMVKTIKFYGLEASFSEVYYPPTVPARDPIFDNNDIREIFRKIVFTFILVRQGRRYRGGLGGLNPHPRHK